MLVFPRKQEVTRDCQVNPHKYNLVHYTSSQWNFTIKRLKFKFLFTKNIPSEYLSNLIGTQSRLDVKPGATVFHWITLSSEWNIYVFIVHTVLCGLKDRLTFTPFSNRRGILSLQFLFYFIYCLLCDESKTREHSESSRNELFQCQSSSLFLWLCESTRPFCVTLHSWMFITHFLCDINEMLQHN